MTTSTNQLNSMVSTNVKITWKAFGDKPERNRFISSLEFSLDSSEVSDVTLMDMIYHDTNVYAGPIWNAIEKLLPANRTHTALSVGDEVEINGITYRCADMGWEAVSTTPECTEDCIH